MLSPDHVRRVLDGAPEPFAPATPEKRAALSHLQPDGVLISRGAARSERRRFNERILEPGRPVHELGDELVAKVREEALALLTAPAGRDARLERLRRGLVDPGPSARLR